MNERQRQAIQRMLEEDEDNFVGGMNVRKYVAITKTSKATATRDLQALVQKGILISKGSGRSTNYRVNLTELPTPIKTA